MRSEPKGFVQMDLLAWGGIHPEQQDPEETPFDQIYRSFTDGITADRLETIQLELPKKIKDRAEISLSRGDSGYWYCGWSAYASKKQSGTGHAAYPKFSEAYATKYEAAEDAMNKALAWLESREVGSISIKAIRSALLDVLLGIDPKQHHRDTTCHEWRDCGYAEQCFAPENDKGEDPVCFKDQVVSQGKEAATKTLADLCRQCRAATTCDSCCATCPTLCNGKQRCRWPEAA